MTPRAKEPSFVEQARQEQIIDAAITVLSREGYGAASLQRIADEAKISKGLISYHFDGRDDLMRRVLYAVFERQSRAVTGGLDFSLSPPELLRAVVRRSAEVGLARSDERRAATEVVANLRGEGGLTFAERDQAYVGFEHMYRMGQASGDFRQFDVRTMAVVHSAAIDGMFLYLDSHPEIDPHEFAAQVADLLLAAVCA